MVDDELTRCEPTLPNTIHGGPRLASIAHNSATVSKQRQPPPPPAQAPNCWRVFMAGRPAGGHRHMRRRSCARQKRLSTCAYKACQGRRPADFTAVACCGSIPRCNSTCMVIYSSSLPACDLCIANWAKTTCARIDDVTRDKPESAGSRRHGRYRLH